MKIFKIKKWWVENLGYDEFCVNVENLDERSILGVFEFESLERAREFYDLEKCVKSEVIF